MDDFLKVEDENYNRNKIDETRQALSQFISTFYDMNEKTPKPKYLFNIDSDSDNDTVSEDEDTEESIDYGDMPELEEVR